MQGFMSTKITKTIGNSIWRCRLVGPFWWVLWKIRGFLSLIQAEKEEE
jgi:hypothetical protein